MPRLSEARNDDSIVIAHGNFTYEGCGTPVYRDFGITLSREKPVLLRGQNGIGKSTLLRLLAGLEEWDAATRDTPAQSARVVEHKHTFATCSSFI